MIYLSFKEIVTKYGLKNEATSEVKIKEIPNELDIPYRRRFACEVYMRVDKFTTPSGIVNLHPTEGTHWIMFSHEFYFVSYGCPAPTNILNHLITRSAFGNGVYSEYRIQKNDSYFAA